MIGVHLAWRPLLSRVPYKWIVAIVFVMALFIDILDVTIVNVALTSISADLGGSFSDTTWISLGYSLSLAVFIPLSGWLGDRFGTKRTFICALTLFMIGSLACSLATSIGQLVAFRVLQGVGGGMLTPVGVTMLFRAFPPQERAKASGILTIPTVLAPALGPLIGGYLVDEAGWRWIFTVNVPVAAVALTLAAFGLKEHTESSGRKFDIPGFVLTATGFPCLVYALERGASEGWTSPRIVITGILGVVLLSLLVYVETHKDEPMLALRLLKDRLFRTTNLASLFSTMSFLGLLFLLPQWLQRVRGLSAFDSGLATFPQAVGVILLSQVASRTYGKIGPRRMLAFGFMGLALTTVGFLFVEVDTTVWFIRALMLIRGFFLAFTFIPLQAASYARISPADTGRASSIFSTQRQLGTALGVAFLSTVLVSVIPAPFVGRRVPVELQGKFTDSFHIAFAVAVGLCVVAAAVSLMIRDEDARATMRPRTAS